MNIDEIYKRLDSIAEKKQVDLNDINILLKLSQNDDPEIRAYVAELLVFANGNEAENTLINMCNDKDELVRVNACDSLSVFPTIEVYNQLIKCILNDKSTIVKSYAILSLVDIMIYIDVDRNELKNLFLSNSKNEEIGICAASFKGLYVLGEEENLKKMLYLTKSENYQDRCAVLNMLEDIITEKNRKYILSVIKELRKTEKSNAVNSTIDRIIGAV